MYLCPQFLSKIFYATERSQPVQSVRVSLLSVLQLRLQLNYSHVIKSNSERVQAIFVSLYFSMQFHVPCFC